MACGPELGAEPPDEAAGSVDAAVGKGDLASGVLATYVGANEYGTLAQDATSVFAVIRGGADWRDAIARINKSTGAAALLASSERFVAGITSDGARAYWTSKVPTGVSYYPCSDNGPRVRSQSGGLTSWMLRYGPPDARACPRGIAADATHVYWAQSGPGRIIKAAKDGSAVTTHASGQTTAYDVSLDATHVYFLTSGSLLRVAKSGGPTQTLASGLLWPFSLALDEHNAYFVNGQRQLLAVPKTGGASRILAWEWNWLGGVDVDASHVYFTDTGTNDWRGLPNPDGRVRRLPKDGTTATTLASGLSRPTAIRVDGAHAYFMTWRKPSSIGLVDLRRISK